MLIIQIIEFELRGRGPPKFSNTFTRTCIRTTDYFYEKTKIFKENLQVDYCSLLKYSKRQCILISRTGSYHLQNLTPKCKILNLFWA